MRTSEAEVAFTVHNPGDPVPATLRGTRLRGERLGRGYNPAGLMPKFWP